MIVPNDFYTLMGRINDLNNNNNKVMRFVKYLMESKNEIAKSVGCIGYNILESMVDSGNIDEVHANEESSNTPSKMMVIEVVGNNNTHSVTFRTTNFDLIRSVLNRSESELDFKLSDFDVDCMRSDSSVDSILQGIADVFDPECDYLEDLELEGGAYRYVSGNTVFIPLNPNKFRSIERIKTLKEYLENQLDDFSTFKLVYNEHNNTIAIICIY